MESRRRSSLFLHVNTIPNPNVNPSLWEHRLRQRRPISQNPFEAEDSTYREDYGLTAVDSPPPSAFRRQSSKYDNGKSGDGGADESMAPNDISMRLVNRDREWGDQIPSWLNLFYDLAWTATFSSLTSNAQFRAPWDTVSYVVFFTTAWWLWVSQVFYNVEFYTDDWFHLLAVFLQLIVFGALAATTRGFDVTNFITHSPGSATLESSDVTTMTPERYGAERLAKVSLRVIMLAICISRILLLIQHLRVAVYAKITSKTKRFPRRLLIVPASLAVSAGLFFAAFRVTITSGKTPHGATTNFILWGVALLVEVVAHIVRFEMDLEGVVKLRSHGSITGRLNDITTIILGEGINAIAGTFYATEQAPGFSGPTGTGIVCCAVIVFLMAYLYFEGAAPLKTVRRRAAWTMMHLPWLLSVILLLEGVKNQLILASFLGSSEYMMTRIENTLYSQNTTPAEFNATMFPLLLQGGMSFDQEWTNYWDMYYANMSANPRAGNLTLEEETQIVIELQHVWFYRLQLKASLNTYNTFMDTDSVSETTTQLIERYQTDYNFTLEDFQYARESPSGFLPHAYGILSDFINPSIENGRYIMAMCGTTFVTLASLNLIQSWPRDRFHWASIFSRYAMGIVMIMLLLLNIGKAQTYVEAMKVYSDKSQWSGVTRWIESGWVLPTLSLSYAIQFIIDTVLVYLAVWFSRKTSNQGEKFNERR